MIEKLSIETRGRTITIEMKEEATVAQLVKSFLRLLMLYGYTEEEIDSTIMKKGEYIKKLEDELAEANRTSERLADRTFQLHHLDNSM